MLKNSLSSNAALMEFMAELRQSNASEAKLGYSLNFVGKDWARLKYGLATETVLKPDKEHNGKPENAGSENIFITGDNLDALKHLQNAYSGKIKMIYIDPPYNTGKEFVYSDRFEFSDSQLRDALGYAPEEVSRLKSLQGKSSHSAWLAFMYPRLKIAQKLLTDDGAIFISIDDNEQANLKLLCDEIFGEGNFVAELIWKNKSGGANDSRFFAIDHEYVLAYAKNANDFVLLLDKEAEVSTSYNLEDENGKYALDRLDKQSIRYSTSLDYVITDNNGNKYRPMHKNPANPNATWRWGKETVKERYSELVFKDGCVYTKNYQKEGAIPRSLLVTDRFGRTRTGKTDFTDLFSVSIFDNPKPYKLIKHLASIATDKSAIILDFFAGSGTAAHAVLELNKEDCGDRKFIMVQLDEPTKDGSEARKAGYGSIDEIARERIRRAGGHFRHFRCEVPTVQTLDNIEKFDPEMEFQPDLFDEMAQAFGEETILQTWLIADGYQFGQIPEAINFAGYAAHYIDNSLYIISKGWEKEQTRELLNLAGQNKMPLNHIRVYGYSIGMESLRELKINVSQSLKNVEIEIRY